MYVFGSMQSMADSFRAKATMLREHAKDVTVLSRAERQNRVAMAYVWEQAAHIVENAVIEEEDGR